MTRTAIAFVLNHRRSYFFGTVFRPLAALFLTSLSAFSMPKAGVAQQSAISLVNQTLKNEAATRNESEHLFYVSEERSTRTGGHLWTQRVVHLKAGVLRRLVAIDGAPLTPEQPRLEDQRIAKIVAHPDALQKANRDRTDGRDMEGVMARAFVFTYDESGGGCTRIHFAPNPLFKPATYEERILHALEGTVSIKEPEGRVCELSGKISQAVEIGYGLLGRLERGGQVHLIRSMTESGTWEVTQMNLHLIGKLLLFKDISQNNDEVRTGFRDLPVDLTLAQAANLAKP